VAGYAHAVAIARAEGVTARELALFAQGIGAIRPPLFAKLARDVDDGSYSGAVDVSEAHGIDAGVMCAVEGMARPTIGLGHGADGFIRVAEVLGRN
jgi:hypothetical protein